VLLECGAQEVQKKTLTPKWDEDKWLLVQEPKTQVMRAQVFDHDLINLKVTTVPLFATL
jgi:Ca2+-dependent lipid-binding protein